MISNEMKQKLKARNNSETIRKNLKNLKEILKKDREKKMFERLVYGNAPNGSKAGTH